MSDPTDMLRLKIQRLRDKITEEEDKLWRKIVEDYSGRGVADSGMLVLVLCTLVVESSIEMVDQLIPIYVAELGVDLDLDDVAKKIKKSARDHFASRRERILGMHAMDLETRTTLYGLRETKLDSELNAIQADLEIAISDLKKSQEPNVTDELADLKALLEKVAEESQSLNRAKPGASIRKQEKKDGYSERDAKLLKCAFACMEKRSAKCRTSNGDLVAKKIVVQMMVGEEDGFWPEGVEIPEDPGRIERLVSDFISLARGQEAQP